ncbi:MAG: hypothetical protein LUH22_17955 [Bacteroides sp.]|nr:hypothetical protein [Bacteroides sp.]
MSYSTELIAKNRPKLRREMLSKCPKPIGWNDGVLQRCGADKAGGPAEQRLRCVYHRSGPCTGDGGVIITIIESKKK